MGRIAGAECLAAERADRCEQGGVVAKQSIQENQHKVIVGFFELPAGAKNAAVPVQGRV